MSSHKFFISCDWGTSNFRLTVVELARLDKVFSHSTSVGIKALYDRFLKQSEQTQKVFFSYYFLEQLQHVPEKYKDCPIVISGMASANIGLQEMDYALMPICADGSNLLYEKIKLSDTKHAILISGARSEQGVMRGEEVQAIGIAEMLVPYGNGMLILPGTHSKHLSYQNGQFEELKTFMTGELFGLLSKDSVLSNSIQEAKWDVAYKNDFKEGVALGLQGKLTENLFSIRVNGLLDRKTPESNYFLLSGMIIGDEVRYLKTWDKYIFLAASQPLIEMYNIALKKALPNIKIVPFNSETTRDATFRGQLKVLRLNGSLGN